MGGVSRIAATCGKRVLGRSRRSLAVINGATSDPSRRCGDVLFSARV